MSITYKFLTSGNDAFVSEGSNLWIYGGAGGDTISSAYDNADTMDGGGGADRLTGYVNDVLLGGGGADTLSGGTMKGGTGDDLYLFNETNVQSLESRVFENANEGIDTILLTVDEGSHYNLPTNVENLFVQGVFRDVNEATSDLVSLTIGGNALNNQIGAGNWHDNISAGAGNDTVWGGTGGDTIRGEDGNDALYGQFGADSMSGGAGADTMDGYSDFDNGINYAYGDRMEGGTGNDVYIVGINDVVLEVAGAGRDKVLTGLTNYTLTEFVEDLTYTGTAAANLKGNSSYNLITTQSAVTGNLTIKGGGGMDTIRTASGNDVINGDDGTDSVSGGGGQDMIRGGTGADRLDGDGGNDSLLGDWGHDTLRGGDGNDILSGLDDNDSLDGGIGADTLEGGNGLDSVWGGSGSDSVRGGAGADFLDGSLGNDTLFGEGDNDVIYGGGGNDTVVGGGGADTLYGGENLDVFQYTGAAQSQGILFDVIEDFKHGEDVIWLAFDADGSYGTRNSYAWTGDAAYGIAGQLWVEFDGADSTAYLDMNGDDFADMKILVKGVQLTDTDFM
jgi:Ca2+-binding RTX toxin-like protein